MADIGAVALVETDRRMWGNPLIDKDKGKTRQKKGNRSAILAAATDLFGAQGYYATSMKKIADASGVAEGTVFNHFASKQEMLMAVISKLYGDLTQQVADRIVDLMDTRERLQVLAQVHLQFITSDNALLVTMIHIHHGVDIHHEYLHKESQMNRLNRTYTRYFHMTIREAMKRGELRPDLDIDICRDMFYGGLEYGQRTIFLRSAYDQVEQYANQSVEQFLNGLVKPEDNETGTNAGGSTALLPRLEQVAGQLEGLVTELKSVL
ncbi:TetR/AcrR family transcriptional regulator [Parahaliea mediterranea]|uniref:TetR/AcrR family transcriptional regulator n=1 Tax=Parahaliea mediterranea TaxID=651086 RepID=UPI001473CA22|nr:TetR/AcrR family transcriptional regulator [Parahaliea mediterranea]